MTSILKDIFNDTLKREGKYSSTLVTMFVFSLSVLLYGWVDFIMHGFNSEVWFTFAAVATGIKLSDAYSKKIKPTLK